MYPTNIPDWRDLLLAYQPPEDHAEAINRAQMAANIVPQCVEVFNALKNAPGLSQDGLRVLLGAAHLIAAGGWHGLAGEAATIIGQRAGELAAVQPGSYQDWADLDTEQDGQGA